MAVKGLGTAAYTASTAYADASHTHTKNNIASWLLANAPSENMPSGQDLDDLKTPGIYTTSGGSGGSTTVQGLSNKPEGMVCGGQLWVINTDINGSANTKQIMFAKNGAIYERQYTGSTWSSWNKLITSNTDRSVEFITGTQTESTGSFTGVSKDTALYNGKTIFYYLPYAGSGNATLNLTMADGTTTGAKSVYWSGTSALTTHYAAGSVISLTYLTSDNAWHRADYNSNTTYSAGTTAQLTTGTDTANRVWPAKQIADYIKTASTGNALINALSTGSSTPVDADYFISQCVGGGTTTTTYHRRPMSALYDYVKGKADSVYAAKSHTHSNFVKSGSTAAAGLVPAPSTTAGTTKYLREDATWQVPPNTTYSNFVKSGSTAAAGLVPSPGTTAGTTKYLREDATWQVPPNDNTDTKVTGTLTEPTSSTTYYPLLATNTATATGTAIKTTGFGFNTTQGTTSAEGVARLYVGNSTAAGTAGNKNGGILIYNNQGKYALIYSHAGDTSNRTIYTPKSGGTLVCHTTDTAIGSASKPVYISASGVATVCTSIDSSLYTNTTYSTFVKSGSSAAAGLVPKPSTTAGTTKYLREDATWQVPPDTNTTYTDFTAATSSAAGTHGLVPAPAAGKQASYLRGDKTWAVPTDTKVTITTY